LDAVIVNPSIIFGPANWETGSAKMFKTVWGGMKFYTKGITGFVDVKDVVRAMILLMNEENFEAAKNQRFLLTSENLSFQNVLCQIADALGKARPQIYASGIILELGWRLIKFVSLINRKQPLITRESVATSKAKNNYDGSKIIKQFNFKYLTVSDSIKQTSGFLKSDMNQNII